MLCSYACLVGLTLRGRQNLNRAGSSRRKFPFYSGFSRQPCLAAGPAKPRPRGSVLTRVDRADCRSEGEGLFALYPRPARSRLLRVGGPLFFAGERARCLSPCEDWPGRRSEARCLARINESFETARNICFLFPGFAPVPVPQRSHVDARWGPRRPAPNSTPTQFAMDPWIVGCVRGRSFCKTVVIPEG